MPRTAKWYVGREEEFAQMWADGVLLKDMAAHFGTRMTNLSQKAKALGLPGRMNPRGDALALGGGDWQYDPSRGISVWVEH